MGSSTIGQIWKAASTTEKHPEKDFLENYILNMK